MEGNIFLRLFWKQEYTLSRVLIGLFNTYIRRKQPSPEPTNVRREGLKTDASPNGKWDGPSQNPQHVSFSPPSPQSLDFEDTDEDHKSEQLDRRYYHFCQICFLFHYHP